MLRQGPNGGKAVIKRALVLAPSSLVKNWQAEFEKWLGNERIQTYAVDQVSHREKIQLKLITGSDVINNFFLKILRRSEKLGRFTNKEYFFKFSKTHQLFHSGGKFSGKKIADNIHPMELFFNDQIK